MKGYWNYDSADGLTGTWRLEGSTAEGTWATDQFNPAIKYDTTPSSNETCIDRDTAASPALTDSEDNTCEYYYVQPDLCGTLDTNTFIAADLCCACSGGDIETLGGVGDFCQGYNEVTERAYPECSEGLECIPLTGDIITVPGQESVCVEVYIPIFFDGTVINREDELTAYWYYNDEGSFHDGWWVNKYNTEEGFWNYDKETTETGTWSNYAGTNEGTWAVDPEDRTRKIDTTQCVDTEAKAVDR